MGAGDVRRPPRIHAFARTDKHLEHLEPIHRLLHDDIRGDLHVSDGRSTATPAWWRREDWVMVASFIDIAVTQGRPTVYVEHGAGQRYVGANPKAAPYYHGSGGHPDNVVAYISPRADVAESWGRPAFAAGAPVCDKYELYGDEKVAAITFHWDGSPPTRVGVPEAGTAFDHYIERLGLIVDRFTRAGWDVLAHHHPEFLHARSAWRRIGMQVATVDEVRRRASLLVADNTSLMYEMLYLGRDVIALNAPWFRRDVEHGLRFWTHCPTVTADSPDELIDLIDNLDSVDFDGNNQTEYVYGSRFSTGDDGRRAATWLTMRLFDHLTSQP